MEVCLVCGEMVSVSALKEHLVRCERCRTDSSGSDMHLHVYMYNYHAGHHTHRVVDPRALKVR